MKIIKRSGEEQQFDSQKIINAVSKLYKKAVVDRLTLCILLLVTLGSYFTPLSPAIFVVVAAVIGICVKKLEGDKKK